MQHGAVEAYTLPCAAGPSGGGGSDSLVTKFASLQRALTSELGNTVGVQVHQKWAPWYVAQASFFAVKQCVCFWGCCLLL